MSYVPPRLVPKRDNLLGLHSEWYNDEVIFRITTRQVGRSDKIIVDVVEYSQGRMAPKKHAQKLACVQARKAGAVSVDTQQLCDFRADRKVCKIDGSVHLVKIRHVSFVFQGVA